MLSLEDWCLDFCVTGQQPISRQSMDDLHCIEAVGWAEANRLGIGGGYRPASTERDGAALAWHFRFGLCMCENGRAQLIPESEAHELWKLIAKWCSSRGLSLTGQYRAFTPEESGTDDPSDTAPTIPH